MRIGLLSMYGGITGEQTSCSLWDLEISSLRPMSKLYFWFSFKLSVVLLWHTISAQLVHWWVSWNLKIKKRKSNSRYFIACLNKMNYQHNSQLVSAILSSNHFKFAKLFNSKKKIRLSAHYQKESNHSIESKPIKFFSTTLVF